MKRKTKNSHLNSSRASKPEKVYTRDDFRVRPVTKEDILVRKNETKINT